MTLPSRPVSPETRELLDWVLARVEDAAKLPDIVRLNYGEGTDPNALRLVTGAGGTVPETGALFVLRARAANDGPVTIEVDGGLPRPLVLRNGEQLPAGHLQPNASAILLGRPDGLVLVNDDDAALAVPLMEAIEDVRFLALFDRAELVRRDLSDDLGDAVQAAMDAAVAATAAQRQADDAQRQVADAADAVFGALKPHPTRAAAAAALASTGRPPVEGETWIVGTSFYLYDASLDPARTPNAVAPIRDLPGLKPFGDATPQHWGSTAYGDEQCDPNDGARLADWPALLAAAQDAYPGEDWQGRTVDDYAMQACLDHSRRTVAFRTNTDPFVAESRGSFGLLKVSNSRAVWPRGFYCLTRDLDGTEFGDGTNLWSIVSEGAVVYGMGGAGQIVLDFTGSRGQSLQGPLTVVGVWTPDGVPLVGIKYGRNASGQAADNNGIDGAVKATGRFALAPFYNYASEDFRLAQLHAYNALDPDRWHASASPGAGSAAFVKREVVAYSGGGSGLYVYGRANAPMDVAVQHVADPRPQAGETITGQTSGAVATLTSDPLFEPVGAGRGGRSFGVVLDGENYWDVRSKYTATPPKDTAASFICHHLNVDSRHVGKGDAVWTCRTKGLDLGKSYLVSEDDRGGSAIVAMANLSPVVLDHFAFEGHSETAHADADPLTGMQNLVSIETARAPEDRRLSAPGLRIRCRKTQAQGAVLRLPEEAEFTGDGGFTLDATCEVHVGSITVTNQTRLVRGAVGRFRSYGTLSQGFVSPGFLNVAQFEDVGGTIITPTPDDPQLRHATGGFELRDLTGRAERYNLPQRLPSAAFLDASNPVNTNKWTGKEAFDGERRTLLYATSGGPTSPWRDALGKAVHVPS